MRVALTLGGSRVPCKHTLVNQDTIQLAAANTFWMQIRRNDAFHIKGRVPTMTVPSNFVHNYDCNADVLTITHAAIPPDTFSVVVYFLA